MPSNSLSIPFCFLISLNRTDVGIARQSIVKPFLINKVEVGNENGWNGVSLGCSLVGARLFCDRG